MKKLLFTGLLGAVLWTVPVPTTGLRASTLTVTNASDSGPGSLRDAIATASPGDEIQFHASLAGIPVELSTGELLIDKNITITGLGIERTTIDGKTESRVINITNGASVTLSGLTITRGHADPGAGIQYKGTLMLRDCAIRGNLAVADDSRLPDEGSATIFGAGPLTLVRTFVGDNTVERDGKNGSAGIFVRGDLTVRDSQISRNVALIIASQSGGGINACCNTVILNSVLSDNIAEQGGGLFIRGALTLSDSSLLRNAAHSAGGMKLAGEANISRTRIEENHAEKFGGGLYAEGQVSITESLVSGNSSGASGGGIFLNGSLTLNHVQMLANTCSEWGGALSNGGFAVVIDSVFAQNRADYGGGVANVGSLHIVNSTVSQNKPEGLGNGGTLTTSNCTIARNGGVGIWNTGTAQVHGTLIIDNSQAASSSRSDCKGSFESRGSNIVGETLDCLGYVDGINGDIVGADAQNVLESELLDNGGATLTHALVPGSLALERIRSDQCLNLDGNPLTTDQRGTVRPQGPACDIGAFEFSYPRNVSFWAQQCRGKGTVDYDGEALQQLLDQVSENYASSAKCVPVECDLLTHGQKAGESIQSQAVRELLASWLNVASGKLTLGRPISLGRLTNTATVGAALGEVQAVVCDPQARHEDLLTARDIAKALNNGDGK